MPLAVYLDEDFVNVEGIAVASMLSFQAASIDCSEFDAPQTDGFSAYCDATFSQQIFDVSVAQVKAIVEPDGVRNDIWEQSVAFIGIHGPVLPISDS
jgi:hypothetical protein